jgi:enoyl-CoA hydratase
MSDNSNAILTEISATSATVILNRPQQRNSLSCETIVNLAAIVSQLTAQRDLRTIIFTGCGDSFAAGADIRELSLLSSDQARDFSRLGQDLFDQIAAAQQVTIAAINGYCLGGGLDLALSCRVRIASKTAVFGHPGGRLGIITGWGGTHRLPRIIRRNLAIEMLVSGRKLNSREALRAGLITDISDPVLVAAKNYIT